MQLGVDPWPGFLNAQYALKKGAGTVKFQRLFVDPAGQPVWPGMAAKPARQGLL
jgi:hypothetical protein